MKIPTIRKNGELFTTYHLGSRIEHHEISLSEYLKAKRFPDYWEKLLLAYRAKHPEETDVESCNVVCWGDKYYLEIWRREGVHDAETGIRGKHNAGNKSRS